jgi:hypothetical protein
MGSFFMISKNKNEQPKELALLSWALGLYLLITSLSVYAEPQLVGHINFAEGSNTAQLPGAAPRILSKDTEIFQGDTIQTTSHSSVVIQFTDDAKVTVRPDSSFSIINYDSKSPDSIAQMELHQGAVEAATGRIAQTKPENFQIKTPTATIKPKSADSNYTVSICDKECEDKQKVVRTEQSVAARVVDIKGVVTAITRADKDAKERTLSLGKALYSSDFIHSQKDSYALLVFADGEKITVQANTEMDIKQYSYKVNDKKDGILLRLITGGLRALTGKIGKNDHNAFSLDTPVATMGIRGTGTDTHTDGLSLDHSTWQGLSFLRTELGEFDVPEGKSSHTLLHQAPKIVDTPSNAPQPTEPRPDTDKTEPQRIFGSEGPTQGDTTIASISGSVAVETGKDQVAVLQKGETRSSAEITKPEPPGVCP